VSLWSLHYLSQEQQQQISLGIPTDSEVLLKGTFDQDSAPSWVTTPIQGIWFLQNSLLVAMIDSSGVSHLMRYQLNTVDKPVVTEIATVIPGHILTSPTANSDGSQIYWSEEWLSNTNMLYSNIWTLQVFDAPRPSHGRWANNMLIVKQLFISDGMSFHPQVVGDNLFMLSTASQNNSTQGTPTSTGTATPNPSLSPNTSVISRTDKIIYAAQLDTSIRGTIFMLPLNADSTVLPTPMNNSGMAFSLQVGTDFALWQVDKGFEMYDVTTGPIPIGNILDSATFLAVNGTSAVWIVNIETSAINNTGSSITLMAFNWPTK